MANRRAVPCLLVVLLAGAMVPASNACSCEHVTDTDLLSHLPRGEDQRRVLCARGDVNAVTAAFCGSQPPSVTSLVELEELLDLGFDGVGSRTGVALTAHSSSLVGRSVSAINPRAILVKLANERDDRNFISLAYTRGDQLVEMALQAPDREPVFYLLRYQRECDDDAGDAEADDGTPGCDFEERLTPATESGWSSWSLYDDEDLKNSVLDCRHCHQPDGPSGKRSFRMQEIQNPWTHWLAAFTPTGRVLLEDYLAAHGPDEVYAGIPASAVRTSNPILVENLVQRTGSEQDNLFPSPLIEAEVTASSPRQPDDNTVPGTSATWDALYARAVAGEVIPPPWHDAKVTDPARLELLGGAYVAWRTGTLDEPFPDVREVFSDVAMAGMSMRPASGLDGRGILVHMCSQCHNSRLDQSLTRARFDATDLDGLSREQKDAAISRLRLPRDDRFHMPPAFFRDLSDEEVEAAVAALER